MEPEDLTERAETVLGGTRERAGRTGERKDEGKGFAACRAADAETMRALGEVRTSKSFLLSESDSATLDEEQEVQSRPQS